MPRSASKTPKISATEHHRQEVAEFLYLLITEKIPIDWAERLIEEVKARRMDERKSQKDLIKRHALEMADWLLED